jgi:mono/diheme cytochrome c family protein
VILAGPPLPASEVGEDRAKIGRTLQRLAETAKRTKTADRGAAYAEMLTTCATCHATPPQK